MAEVTAREFRRFTAIALVHPELQSHADVSRRLGRTLGGPKKVDHGPVGWSVTRMEYIATRKYYRDSVSNEARERSDGFAHDVYVATKDFGGRIGPVLLIASPYIHFLEAIHNTLQQALSQPAIQYLGIDMAKMYASLNDSGANTAVNRVTMQVIGEKNADLVSLSGKMPLHSNIHKQLLGITKPYGIGVRVEHNETDCRVGVTRHGRINWFQTAEDRVAHPLALLDQVNTDMAMLKVRRYPLMHEPRDAIVTAETE